MKRVFQSTSEFLTRYYRSLKCPAPYREAFVRDNSRFNMARIRVLAYFFIVLSSLFAVYFFRFESVYGYLPTPYAALFHVSNVGMGIVLLVLIGRMKRNPVFFDRFGWMLDKVLIVYVGIWSMLASLFAQWTHAQITVLLLGILFSAVITFTRPLFLFFYYLVLTSAFVALLPLFQSDPVLYVSHTVNATYFVAIAWFIGATLFRFRMNTFVQHKVIEGQNARLQEVSDTWENLSTIDALTGVKNRRSFDEEMAKEWNRAIRDHQHFSIAMADLDFFKAYNDRYGHLAGDECLKAIASEIGRHLKRSGDCVYRIGGEEFVVCFANTDLAGSLHACECIRAAIEALSIPHADSPYPTATVSFGLSSLVPDPNSSFPEFLDHVDRLLYEAKKQGRNRVIVE
jgi:diguanylate cyclase (GGDEF)-like protein